MFNPLADNFQDLTDSEIQGKVQDLTKRYYQTKNPNLQNQIAVFRPRCGQVRHPSRWDTRSEKAHRP